MKSMTGYGAAEGRVGKGVFFAEVRGVNSRFLDLNCKIPYRLNPIEHKVRNLIQNNIIRGKIDVFLKEKSDIEESHELVLNLGLAKQYRKCLSELESSLGGKASSHLLEVIDLKELVSFREKSISIDRFWKNMERVIRLALDRFNEMRSREGAALKKDQVKRIARLEKKVTSIRAHSKGYVGEYRKKMLERMKQNGTAIVDPDRIDSELAVLSDRVDVTEELTRLMSHMSQYRALINKAGAVGRQIDFLIQEMHREINTIGSKASDGSISGLVVEFKAELEKLREQAQNIE